MKGLTFLNYGALTYRQETHSTVEGIDPTRGSV